MISDPAAERARYERMAGCEPRAEGLTVHGLALRYLAWARSYYRPRRGNSEAKNARDALKALFLYRDLSASSFGPRQLRACREWMIEKGWARTTINDRIRRLRKCWKWGASRELVPAECWHALQAVEALARGRSVALDPPPIRPVNEGAYRAALAFMPAAIAALCELQWWTGARPGEAVIIAGEHIQMGGGPPPAPLPHPPLATGGQGRETRGLCGAPAPVWIYRPPYHKTQHFGKDRVIWLGPQAQTVLRPWLKPGYLFLSRFKRPYTVNGL